MNPLFKLPIMSKCNIICNEFNHNSPIKARQHADFFMNGKIGSSILKFKSDHEKKIKIGSKDFQRGKFYNQELYFSLFFLTYLKFIIITKLERSFETPFFSLGCSTFWNWMLKGQILKYILWLIIYRKYL